MDRRGLIMEDSYVFKAEIHPYDAEISPATIEGWIEELIAIGRLFRFTHGRKAFLYAPHMPKHQSFHKNEKSDFPQVIIPGSILELFDESDADTVQELNEYRHEPESSLDEPDARRETIGDRLSEIGDGVSAARETTSTDIGSGMVVETTPHADGSHNPYATRVKIDPVKVALEHPTALMLKQYSPLRPKYAAAVEAAGLSATLKPYIEKIMVRWPEYEDFKQFTNDLFVSVRRKKLKDGEVRRYVTKAILIEIGVREPNRENRSGEPA